MYWCRLYFANLDTSNTLLLTIEDITEIKQYQNLFTENKNELDTVEEVARVGYWMLNAETMEAFWSHRVYEILDLDLDEKGGPEILENLVLSY